MRRGAITRDAVPKTIAEYDQLERSAFLEKYGFREARLYLLVHAGRTYDSKAIAGVAHKWAHGRVLRSDEFSGGKAHAAAWLRRLGFEVKSGTSPDWSRDEVILACDLVMANGWQGLSTTDARVGELSDLLQLMPIHAEADRDEKFRNPDFVAKKTHDIATQHPDRRSKPTKVQTLNTEVLDEFRARPGDMAEVARLIRKVTAGDLQSPSPAEDEDLDDDYSAPEGRLLMRLHRSRERNKRLRKQKIASALSHGRRLSCEACAFDFGEVYGDRGNGYIECHHVIPLHEAGEGETKLSDLALICANCHRMIHRQAPWPTPKQLRTLIESRR